MIMRRDGDRLVCVRQTDHQAQCLLMARAWGGEAIRIEHWASVELAAACHDDGWADVDADPAAHPTVDFTRIATEDHCALYERGIAAAESLDPRAGLIVSMHGQGLHQQRLGLDGPVTPVDRLSPPARDFALAQLARQDRLAEAIGDDIALAVWRWDAYRLLQAWDSLSLYLIWRGLPDGRAGEVGPAPLGPGDGGVRLRLEPLGRHTAICDPFPFAAAEVALPVVTRTVPAAADPRDLAAALAEADEVEVEYVLCRSAGG